MTPHVAMTTTPHAEFNYQKTYYRISVRPCDHFLRNYLPPLEVALMAVSDDQLKFSKKYEVSLEGGIFPGRQGYLPFGKNEINQTAVP